MTELYAFLLWLICVGISAIAIGYFIKYYGFDSAIKREGFTVYACPSNSTTYITKNGETNCCNGNIVDGICNGNNLCSLSPTNALSLPSCQDYISDIASDSAVANCFNDMPYYFEASDGSLKGCSASTTTDDGTAPTDPNKMQCILYPTEALDKIKLDSCYNYLKNKAALSGANCPVATSGATSAATSAATNGATSAATNGATSAATSGATNASSMVSSVGQQASSAANTASSSVMGALRFGSTKPATPATPMP